MATKLQPGDDGAICLYEGYMAVREQVRDRERTLMVGRGLSLSGVERERWQERDTEMQIRHVYEETQEAEELARLNGDEALLDKQRSLRQMLEMLLHCLVGKRWAEEFCRENPTITVERMAERIANSEADVRKRIGKSKLTLPKSK